MKLWCNGDKVIKNKGKHSYDIDRKTVSRNIVIRQSLASLADNFSAPYIGYYLASLTPSGIKQGILQFSINALPTLAQVLIGPYIDRFKGYVLVLLVSSSIASFMWIAISLIIEPLVITLLVTLRAICVGITGLSFTAFIGFIFSGVERGKILSKVNVASQLTALVAFVITALMINPSVDTLRTLFAFSGMLSLIASILWFRILYIDKNVSGSSTRGRGAGLLSSLKIVIKNKPFIKLSIVYPSHLMALSLAWPWFPLMQKYVLNMTVAEVAIMNICGTTATMVTQYLLISYLHKLDIRKTITISRIGFTLLPLFYAFAYSPIHIYIANLLLGPFIALSNIFIPLYVFKVSTHDMYASYFAIFNFLQGITTALGSMIGGIVADTIIVNNNFSILRYAMIIDAVIRMITALLHIKIEKV